MRAISSSTGAALTSESIDVLASGTQSDRDFAIAAATADHITVDEPRDFALALQSLETRPSRPADSATQTAPLGQMMTSMVEPVTLASGRDADVNNSRESSTNAIRLPAPAGDSRRRLGETGFWPAVNSTLQAIPCIDSEADLHTPAGGSRGRASAGAASAAAGPSPEIVDNAGLTPNLASATHQSSSESNSSEQVSQGRFPTFESYSPAGSATKAAFAVAGAQTGLPMPAARVSADSIQPVIVAPVLSATGRSVSVTEGRTGSTNASGAATPPMVADSSGTVLQTESAAKAADARLTSTSIKNPDLNSRDLRAASDAGSSTPDSFNRRMNSFLTHSAVTSLQADTSPRTRISHAVASAGESAEAPERSSSAMTKTVEFAARSTATPSANSMHNLAGAAAIKLEVQPAAPFRPLTAVTHAVAPALPLAQPESARTAALRVELGEGQTVHARVQQRGDGIGVRIVAEDTRLAGHITHQLASLRRNLEATGLHLNEADVSYRGERGDDPPSRDDQQPSTPQTADAADLFTIQEATE